MKRLLILAALIPFAALAQPLNTMNNPNQQGYVIPNGLLSSKTVNPAG